MKPIAENLANRVLALRRGRVSEKIDLNAGPGLEIGALSSPLVTRAMGQVYYVDHADSAALRAKYREDPAVDVSRIVDVDFVWGDRSLAEITAGHGPFAYVIASHVAEHVPDLVTWLQEVQEVLKPGGVLSLILPDKRFTFDVKRRETGVADLLDAHLRQLRRPSPSQIYDHFANACEVNVSATWRGGYLRVDSVSHASPRDALALARHSVASGEYIDSHCSVFTPRSFLSVMAELHDIGLMPLELSGFRETEYREAEFYVSLAKPRGGDASNYWHDALIDTWPCRGLERERFCRALPLLRKVRRKSSDLLHLRRFRKRR